tara:strand:+ start:12 stop:266 length:255 start_codon:yes stop_codon:yes gene_type:complete
MTEEFRIYVHDHASECATFIARWHFDKKEDALRHAKELCDKLSKEKDFLRNLTRYSITVYRFWGTNLKFRDDPIFDSYKEYAHA